MTDSPELAARLAELEAENAQLRAASGVVEPAARASRGRWRAGSVNSGLRRGLAQRGADTGAFGTWLYRWRTLVLVVIAAAPVAWLLLLRPLSVGDVVLVLVVSLIVWWLVEVLQRHPEDVAAAADAATTVR
ncbi:hypothetical protein [Microbacterium aurum]